MQPGEVHSHHSTNCPSPAPCGLSWRALYTVLRSRRGVFVGRDVRAVRSGRAIAVRKRVGLVLTSLALLVALGLPASVSADLQAGLQLATAWTPPVNGTWQRHGIDPLNPAACDPLDPAQCMLPYPNDWFTRPDTSSLTGRRP